MFVYQNLTNALLDHEHGEFGGLAAESFVLDEAAASLNITFRWVMIGVFNVMAD